MITLPRWLIVLGFWIPFAFTTYAAFAPEGVDLGFRVSDIVLHAAAFSYLTAALWRAHFARDTSGRWSAGWMAAYGIAIEAIQSFEPARTAEFKDLAVDAAGIIAGVALYRLVGSRIRTGAFAVDVPQPRS